MFTKPFLQALLVSIAIAEIHAMARIKRGTNQLQCPSSPVELTGTEWNM